MNKETLIQELKKKISRNQAIIDGLANYEPFRLFIEDCQENIKRADNNWHLINLDKPELFHELKYSKLGALLVINAMESYKQDIETAHRQIETLQNSGNAQNSYTDE